VWSNGGKTPTGEYRSSEGITCPSANLSTTNLSCTGQGPKVTAVVTARPSRPEIHLQSGHKSPCLRLCVPHVTTRAAISEGHTIRLYFFDTSVNHSAYLKTPQTWFFPQLSELSCYPATDNAPPHCALPVRQNLANSADTGRTWCGLYDT